MFVVLLEVRHSREGVFKLGREVRKPVKLLSNILVLYFVVWKRVKFDSRGGCFHVES